MTITVRRAGVEDLDALAPLFDAYRQFYRQPGDVDQARGFLEQRMARNESVVFLAEEDGRALGFTQLFPSFSSVSMAPVVVLNDIYVAQDARRSGVGRILLDAAVAHGRVSGAVRLTLSTQWNNSVAQAAYERHGWQASTDFKTYNFTL